MKFVMIWTLLFSCYASASSINDLLKKAASDITASVANTPGITAELVIDPGAQFFATFNDRSRVFEFFTRDWSQLSWHTDESESSLGKKVESVIVRIKLDQGPSIGIRLKRTTIASNVGSRRSPETLDLQDQMARSMIAYLPLPVIVEIPEDDAVTKEAWGRARKLLSDARFEKRYSFLDPFFPDFKSKQNGGLAGPTMVEHYESLRYFSKREVDSATDIRESATKILAALEKVHNAARNITSRQSGWQFKLSRSSNQINLQFRGGHIFSDEDPVRGISQAIASYVTLSGDIYEQIKKTFDLVKILIENGSLAPKGKILGVIPKPFSASHKGLQEQLFNLIDGLRETYKISLAMQSQERIDLGLSSDPREFTEEVIRKSLENSEYMHKVENQLKQALRLRLENLTTTIEQKIAGSCIHLLTKRR